MVGSDYQGYGYDEEDDSNGGYGYQEGGGDDDYARDNGDNGDGGTYGNEGDNGNDGKVKDNGDEGKTIKTFYNFWFNSITAQMSTNWKEKALDLFVKNMNTTCL